MYKTKVYVGVFRELYDYELKPRRFFFMALIFAKIELLFYPLRMAVISK